MKFPGFTKIEVALALGVTSIAAMALLPALAETANEARQRVKMESTSCQGNLQQIGRGIMMYAQDADGQLPPASTKSRTAYGWADLLQPYLHDTKMYQCPSETTPANLDPKKVDYIDYFYNKNLSGLSTEKLETPSVTLMAGDGAAGNARSSMDALPHDWMDKPGPGRRHFGGANYAFADGHVKWIQPGATTTNSIYSGGTNTFAVK